MSAEEFWRSRKGYALSAEPKTYIVVATDPVLGELRTWPGSSLYVWSNEDAQAILSA